MEGLQLKRLLLLLAALVLILTGCLNTESDVNEEENADSNAKSNSNGPTLEILGMGSAEDDLNILRDQLTKNSFNVKYLNHLDRKSTRLNSSHVSISYAVFCWKKKNCDLLRYERQRCHVRYRALRSVV